MSRLEPAHILIVYPPPAPPFAPPPQMTWLALQPGFRRLPLEQYDANLDFFDRYIFNPLNLHRFISIVETNRARGVYTALDPGAQKVIDDLAENRPQWEKRIAGVGRSLSVCREEGFYRPENSVRALDSAAALLKLASLAFYPAKIGWYTFDHPRTGDPAGLRAFGQDASSNPFREQCKTGLVPKLGKTGLRLLLLWVSSEDQLPASATMAYFSKKANPALHVAVAGASGLPAGCKHFADCLLTVPDDRLVSKLKQFTGGEDNDRAAAGAGSSCFFHEPISYLSPAPVLSIDLGMGGVQPDSPARLSELIHTCEEKLGAWGVYILDDGGLARYFSGTGHANVGKKPSCGLGICTRLREVCREIDGKSLHLAGVRLIVWQAPEGSPEVLQAVLWQMSRAGIWNHLRVPNCENNALVDALTVFAAANPNIVHSWDYARPVEVSADISAGPGAPAVYRRVRKLPGRPFWRILNDPAHLMLYLARHGRQQVMRWRVPDNPGDVYTLGSKLDYHYKSPGNLPPGYLDEICLMVADGGSVDMSRVRDNLEKAFLIAYAMENGVIVGDSSLKNPRAEYIRNVNRQSGLDLTHYVERGYTSVRPEYRGMGIGARLLAGLTKRAGGRKVFSVISADNEAARTMAIRNRTRQVAEYYSPRLGKRVGVWIPEWMLDG